MKLSNRVLVFYCYFQGPFLLGSRKLFLSSPPSQIVQQCLQYVVLVFSAPWTRTKEHGAWQGKYDSYWRNFRQEAVVPHAMRYIQSLFSCIECIEWGEKVHCLLVLKVCPILGAVKKSPAKTESGSASINPAPWWETTGLALINNPHCGRNCYYFSFILLIFISISQGIMWCSDRYLVIVANGLSFFNY